MKQHHKSLILENKYKIILLAILILGIYSNFAFFYGPSWINGSDNYLYTAKALIFSQGNFKNLNCQIVDCTNYIVIGGIGLFFAAFGYGLFTASLFGVLCFLLTIIVIYLIGKELHSPLAGLISAFFYSIFPLVLSQSSNVGDDISLVFFISLSVLFLIYALKPEKIKKRYFFLSGFFAAINILSVSEAAIGIFFTFTFLVILLLLKRDKKTMMGTGAYIIGIILAISIIALIGIYETGSPTYVISVYTVNFNTIYTHNPLPLFSYINTFFAHMPLKNLDRLGYAYFGYAFVISALYLIVTKYKKAVIAGYWFAFSFLYLSFGSETFKTYSPVQYMARFSIIIVPATVLIIGIALAHLIQKERKHKKGLIIAYFVVGIAILILTISSLENVIYIGYSQLYATEPLLQIGKYLNNLPANTMILGPVDIPWSAYLKNQSRSIQNVGYGTSQQNCSGITNTFKLTSGDYLVGNVTNYSNCSLEIAYVPSAPDGLKKYTAFVPWGPNFYYYKVYKVVNAT